MAIVNLCTRHNATEENAKMFFMASNKQTKNVIEKMLSKLDNRNRRIKREREGEVAWEVELRRIYACL